MKEQDDGLLISILKDTFSKTFSNDLRANYLPKAQDYYKWICYSDYCIGDKNKPNNVITFSLVPYIDDQEDLSAHVKSIASNDIKNSKKVGAEFIKFLNEYPLVNFSFIIDDIKSVLGQSPSHIQSNLMFDLEALKNLYRSLIDTGSQNTEYHRLVIKKIDKTLQHVKHKQKIKQICEMLVISLIGAYVSSIIVNHTKATKFAWFSDRDAINEVSNSLSTDLFHYFLHVLNRGPNLDFNSSSATSKDELFYDELLKIPDYIAGTLADYDSNYNEISKDKFKTMLVDYMAGNVTNNFIFQIKSNPDGGLTCSRVTIHLDKSQ
jgi:hypothetical protein